MTDPTTPSPVLLAARSRSAQMLADIQRLIEIETPSSDLAAVARGAEVVADLVVDRLAARPETIVIDGVTHLRLRFGDGPSRVVLLDHQDTVWPAGTLERLPFSTTQGVLRGPGSFDMLTGVVMSIHATALLQEFWGDGAVDGVCLLITGDEEVGSATSRELILESSKGADAVLVMEASGDGGALKTARKGGSTYRLHLSGRSAHAGLEPEQGISALSELAAQLPAIAGLADAAVGTTVTPTTFGGGTTKNTVPAQAWVDVDVRALSRAEQERVDAGLRALQPMQAGASLDLEGGINRPPLEAAWSEGLYGTYRSVVSELGLPTPSAVEVGGCSDGNFTAGAGIPTLDGLGAVGAGAHADHEHAVIAEIAPRTATLAGLMARVLGAQA